ncbi:uncharacterized protein LOC129269043 [Lytechinus pictus]|uniref:uncharacterized protein LOC129269043 n=1 Tax=Lytechinus pictus TaxID=7653 RepID=UPI0030B9BA82
MGLTPGTEYDVNIQGVTSTGVREDQGNFNVFTGPNPPIDGRFTEINGMTVLLEWNPPDDGRIDGYIVIHGAETQDPTTLVQAIIPVGQTAYAISGLNPTTPYTIGLVSYRNSTDTFSDFAELLQQQNSNFVINRGDNQCASRPCINGGQCYGVSGGSFRCECISGFSGITCAIDTNLNTSSPISTNLSGISTNTMIAVTMSHYTMNPVTSSDATGTLVTTPKLQTTSNYVIYITVAAVVLLILLVLSIILCSRKKTRSSRKKTQDANTEPNLALPLGPLPQRPGSRPYDTKIVTTAPTHGLSNHGQLDVYADIL